MNETMKSMLEHPFFKDFQTTHVELLSNCASITEFNAGGYLFRDGETADRLYLIQTGKIAIELEMAGRDPLLIMTVGAGGVVGWSWILQPNRWHFSTRVMENTSAIILDAKCIMVKCREDYQLGYELMWRSAQLIGERLQATRAQLLSLKSC